MLRIFTSCKNPSTSVGFEPANLGSRGEHVSPRPPRLTKVVRDNKIKFLEREISVEFVLYVGLLLCTVTLPNSFLFWINKVPSDREV